MQMLFHTNLAKLMINRGILEAGFKAPCGITIYSGVQPNAADVEANWSAYNSSNASFLAHYSGVVWSQPTDAMFCSITTFPAEVVPTHAGVGTWCICWNFDPTAPQLASTTLPGSFLTGAVSTLTGNGIVRFNSSVDFVLTVPKTIIDGVLTAAII